jgi:hypothetical protein
MGSDLHLIQRRAEDLEPGLVIRLPDTVYIPHGPTWQPYLSATLDNPHPWRYITTIPRDTQVPAGFTVLEISDDHLDPSPDRPRTRLIALRALHPVDIQHQS